MENNFYFEQKKQFFGNLSDESLRNNVDRCEAITQEFQTSVAWNQILEDARGWCKTLDGNWQNIYDDKKLEEARILKHAYVFIAGLPQVYAQDLEFAKTELASRTNYENGNILDKDYDTETIYE